MLSSVTGESNVDWRDVLRPTGSCLNNGIYCLRTNISSSFSVAIIWNQQRKYNIICHLEEIPFLCLSSGLSTWDCLKHSQKAFRSMRDFVPQIEGRSQSGAFSVKLWSKKLLRPSQFCRTFLFVHLILMLWWGRALDELSASFCKLLFKQLVSTIAEMRRLVLLCAVTANLQQQALSAPLGLETVRPALTEHNRSLH